MTDTWFDPNLDIPEGLKGAQAAPVDEVTLLLGLEPYEAQENIYDDGEWLSTTKQENSIDLSSRYVGTETVPNVIGMSAKDAVFLIQKTGMRVKLQGYGTVSSQSIPAGTKVNDNTVVLQLK